MQTYDKAPSRNNLSKEAVMEEIRRQAEEKDADEEEEGIIRRLMKGLRKGGPVNKGIRRKLDDEIEKQSR